MVNIICSEWIPLENISFKIGYLLIGKWCDYPPPEGALGEGGTVILNGKTYYYHRWCGGCGECGVYGMDGEVFCISVWDTPIHVQNAVCAGDF